MAAIAELPNAAKDRSLENFLHTELATRQN